MKTIAKAGAIIIAGTLALYVVLFLVDLPLMAKAPVGMTSSMASGVYASLYRPVRDALPSDNVVRRAWQDYEHYWCSGSTRCRL
jgi:hypothetical protein